MPTLKVNSWLGWRKFTINKHIYAREEVSFAKFLFLPSWFAKILESNFSYFAKIRWMPSWFAKLSCSWTATSNENPSYELYFDTIFVRATPTVPRPKLPLLFFRKNRINLLQQFPISGWEKRTLRAYICAQRSAAHPPVLEEMEGYKNTFVFS
jgi:hypothetical protein